MDCELPDWMRIFRTCPASATNAIEPMRREKRVGSSNQVALTVAGIFRASCRAHTRNASSSLSPATYARPSPNSVGIHRIRRNAAGVVRRMVAAFEGRAKQLYGSGP